MRQTVENGWSRNVLVHQIDSGLYKRQGKALTNFKRTLPAPQSDLAQQIVKDPYTFEFLSLSVDMQERDLERGLLEHLRLFILELGKGFAFVGSQYHLEVGGQDYYLDLLFYHLRLRCFVVFELKIEEFKPEFAGKMNFYLSAVDDQLKHADDQPSIGVILLQGPQRCYRGICSPRHQQTHGRCGIPVDFSARFAGQAAPRASHNRRSCRGVWITYHGPLAYGHRARLAGVSGAAGRYRCAGFGNRVDDRDA